MVGNYRSPVHSAINPLHCVVCSSCLHLLDAQPEKVKIWVHPGLRVCLLIRFDKGRSRMLRILEIVLLKRETVDAKLDAEGSEKRKLTEGEMADQQGPEVPERSQTALVRRVAQANGKWGERRQKWSLKSAVMEVEE